MPSHRDGFNRANSDSLGAPWVEAEDATSVLRIESNQILTASGVGSAGIAYYDVTPPIGAIQLSEARWISETSRLGAGGPAVRLSSGSVGSSTGYFAGLGRTLSEGSPAFVYLWKMATGPVSHTALASASHGWSSGDKVTLLASGNILEVRINGALKILASDSSYPSGRVGMAVDVFSFPGSARWDDWFGGDSLPEVASVIAHFDMSATREAGGGLHDFASAPIIILGASADWHRTHIRINALWSSSSEAHLRRVEAVAQWNVETIPVERDHVVVSLRTRQVGGNVTIL